MKREKKEYVCPYLDTSHSKAILYYVCEAGKKSFKIKPGNIDDYPCFTAGYKDCKRAKRRGRGNPIPFSKGGRE